MRIFSRSSLTGRIVSRVTVCVFVLWLVATMLAALVINDELGEAFDTGLQETARRALPLAVQFVMNRTDTDDAVHVPAFGNGGGSQGRENGKDDKDGNGSDEYLIYQLRDKSGKVLLRSHDSTDLPFAAPLDSGFWEDRNFRYYTEPSVSGTLFLQVAEPIGHRHEATFESSLAVLLPLIVLIPAIVIAIWLNVRSGLMPVRRLRDEIGLRGRGNFDAIQLDETPHELTDMVNAINMLLVRLRAALNAERNFAANSAHELRTPIASALAQLQQLLLEIGEASPYRDRAKKVEASLNRLRRLSEKLLQWSRAESGIGRSVQSHHLYPIVEMVVEDIKRSNRFENTVRVEKDNVALFAAIDPDAFGICLRNLLENGLMHGSRNEPVVVKINGPNRITVENAGSVVPPDVLSRLMQRFERHGNHPESVGLGLSITATIIAQAGGQLELFSPRPGKSDGFAVILSLN